MPAPLSAAAASVPGSPVPGPSAAGDTLAQRVIAWQVAHGRHGLPWQGTRDPYRVWLSEIMLQQTQVGTVLGYYERFLVRFPNVVALAAAPLDEVLALWSGLGYYSRARNLHRCAVEVVSRYGGHFPSDSGALQTLPGIGRSTAAAIAAFCFGERAAILDGNVKRVLARALGFEGDLAERRHELVLWERAQALLPEQGIEGYTQGLMDLGAQVCTRRQPRCAQCPLAGLCAARAAGRPEEFPVKTRRVRRTRQTSALLWLTHREAVWLVQRPATGVWAGLWSLPEWPVASGAVAPQSAGEPMGEVGVTPAASADRAERAERAERPNRPDWADWPGQGEWLPPFLHVLTHRDWTLQPLRWTWPDTLEPAEFARLTQLLQATAGLGRGRWWEVSEVLALGLPAPVRRLLGG
jgi:A/G-specific adenine glycosylase